MNFETMTPSKQESEKRSRETSRVVVREQPLHLDVYSTKLDSLRTGIVKTMASCRNLFKTLDYKIRAKGSPSMQTVELALTEAQSELFSLQGEISRVAGLHVGPRDKAYEQLMKYGQEVNEKITEVSNALYNLKRIEKGIPIDIDGNPLSLQTGERLPPRSEMQAAPVSKPAEMPAWTKGMPTPTPPKTTWGKLKRFFGY